MDLMSRTDDYSFAFPSTCSLITQMEQRPFAFEAVHTHIEEDKISNYKSTSEEHAEEIRRCASSSALYNFEFPHCYLQLL